MAESKSYRKFSERVCNIKEAGFIGLGFVIAIVVVGSIILGIYFGTQCAAGKTACRDGYTCIDDAKVCDGTRDCPIGDDEWKCAPKDFYVAFRTNQRVVNLFAGFFNADNSSIDAGSSGPAIGLRDSYKNQLTRVLEQKLTDNKVTNVNVFRFRRVNETGQDGLNHELLAVDAFVTVENVVPISDNTTRKVTPTTIKNALVENGGVITDGVFFDQPGEAVTTGVGVILTGPETCTRQKVYCSKDCVSVEKDGYVYGSTKGCPEYPCACVNKA